MKSLSTLVSLEAYRILFQENCCKGNIYSHQFRDTAVRWFRCYDRTASHREEKLLWKIKKRLNFYWNYLKSDCLTSLGGFEWPLFLYFLLFTYLFIYLFSLYKLVYIFSLYNYWDIWKNYYKSTLNKEWKNKYEPFQYQKN